MSEQKKHSKKEHKAPQHTLGKIKYKTVLVNVMTKYMPNGTSVLTACRPKVYDIVQYYLGGTVRTNTGDVWRVKPHGGNEADYIVDEAVRG